MTFFLIYLIGALIALIIAIRYTIKEFDVITLGDMMVWLTYSLLSWIVVLVEIGRHINWDRQTWKRKA